MYSPISVNMLGAFTSINEFVRLLKVEKIRIKPFSGLAHVPKYIYP